MPPRKRKGAAAKPPAEEPKPELPAEDGRLQLDEATKQLVLEKLADMERSGVYALCSMQPGTCNLQQLTLVAVLPGYGTSGGAVQGYSPSSTGGSGRLQAGGPTPAGGAAQEGEPYHATCSSSSTSGML